MAERQDAVRSRSNLSGAMLIVRLLHGLTGLFGSCQMLLFAVLFGNAVGMSSQIAQFRRSLMVLVTGSVVLARRHRIQGLHPASVGHHHLSVHDEDQSV